LASNLLALDHPSISHRNRLDRGAPGVTNGTAATREQAMAKFRAAWEAARAASPLSRIWSYRIHALNAVNGFSRRRGLKHLWSPRRSKFFHAGKLFNNFTVAVQYGRHRRG
jgi:hypothetical protein